ncbi:tol-pal system-associated acyl-CoA thioesterase [Marinovum sp.]|uniref:tol-pal system-associated acyl-CoA thioesterase n=1 Tax=Marinovum sp. TaxID=2024839 RepID=UPI002B2761B3|nr:tol-pal system-associated acyl-CoA thioesterase [Marinovum sp.]
MHRFDCRVYYEDTDMAGIVYHANFLKFIERGRSEWVAALGIDQRAMREASGQVFVVRRIECDYLSPAHYGDDLMVLTTPERIGGARMVLRQQVLRGAALLFEALVTVVVLGSEGQVLRLPPELRRALA